MSKNGIRVVFLDIDGVLNNLGSVIGLGNPSKFFDPVSVALVDKLCREGDASIVISSSWRSGDAEQLIAAMELAGAKKLVGHIIGETPILWRNKEQRGDEIAAWLKERPGLGIERYVIVDDDSDMLPGQPFVQTTFEDGFRFKHYISALRYLNPEHCDCNDRSVIIPSAEQKD